MLIGRVTRAILLIAAISTDGYAIAPVIFRVALAAVTASLVLRAHRRRTVDLVRTVATIIVKVTSPPTRNASLVGALEIRLLCTVLRTILLISVVTLATVLVTVTTPRLRNTPARAAGKISIPARHVAIVFIGTVSTVVVIVTPPHVRNAALVVTCKLSGRARW